MVATYFVTELIIGAFEIPRIVILYLHRETHKNTGKFSKLSFIGPEILTIFP